MTTSSRTCTPPCASVRVPRGGRSRSWSGGGASEPAPFATRCSRKACCQRGWRAPLRALRGRRSDASESARSLRSGRVSPVRDTRDTLQCPHGCDGHGWRPCPVSLCKRDTVGRTHAPGAMKPRLTDPPRWMRERDFQAAVMELARLLGCVSTAPGTRGVGARLGATSYRNLLPPEMSELRYGYEGSSRARSFVPGRGGDHAAPGRVRRRRRGGDTGLSRTAPTKLRHTPSPGTPERDLRAVCPSPHPRVAP
jgi:hypothetical protein